MIDMRRARRGEMVQSLHALFRLTILPGFLYVHQSGSSLNPVLSGLLWRLHYIITTDEIIGHFDSTSSLSSLPGGQCVWG